MPASKMATHIQKAFGIRCSLAQTRSYMREANLDRMADVTFKQFKAFYMSVRPKKAGGGGKSKSKGGRSSRDDDDEEDGGSEELEEGQKCEGNFEGRGQWYPGVVERKWKNGMVDILYDDGEKERRVKPENVRSLKKGGKGKKRSKLLISQNRTNHHLKTKRTRN